MTYSHHYMSVANDLLREQTLHRENVAVETEHGGELMRVLLFSFMAILTTHPNAAPLHELVKEHRNALAQAEQTIARTYSFPELRTRAQDAVRIASKNYEALAQHAVGIERESAKLVAETEEFAREAEALLGEREKLLKENRGLAQEREKLRRATGLLEEQIKRLETRQEHLSLGAYTVCGLVGIALIIWFFRLSNFRLDRRLKELQIAQLESRLRTDRLKLRQSQKRWGIPGDRSANSVEHGDAGQTHDEATVKRNLLEDSPKRLAEILGEALQLVRRQAVSTRSEPLKGKQ